VKSGTACIRKQCLKLVLFSDSAEEMRPYAAQMEDTGETVLSPGAQHAVSTGDRSGLEGAAGETILVLRDSLPQNLRYLRSEDVEVDCPLEELIDDFNQDVSE
jgi:hypothetical protein